jgi:hypothetical protein
MNCIIDDSLTVDIIENHIIMEEFKVIELPAVFGIFSMYEYTIY